MCFFFLTNGSYSVQTTTSHLHFIVLIVKGEYILKFLSISFYLTLISMYLIVVSLCADHGFFILKNLCGEYVKILKIEPQ